MEKHFVGFKAIYLRLFLEKKILLLCKFIILENVLNNQNNRREFYPSLNVILLEASRKFRLAAGGDELYSTNICTKP